jgi:hypothetical protein
MAKPILLFRRKKLACRDVSPRLATAQAHRRNDVAAAPHSGKRLWHNSLEKAATRDSAGKI